MALERTLDSFRGIDIDAAESSPRVTVRGIVSTEGADDASPFRCSWTRHGSGAWRGCWRDLDTGELDAFNIPAGDPLARILDRRYLKLPDRNPAPH